MENCISAACRCRSISRPALLIGTRLLTMLLVALFIDCMVLIAMAPSTTIARRILPKPAKRRGAILRENLLAIVYPSSMLINLVAPDRSPDTENGRLPRSTPGHRDGTHAHGQRL